MKFKQPLTFALLVAGFVCLPPALAQQQSQSQQTHNGRMNQMLSSRVSTKLAQSAALQHSNISVKVDGNTVTLDGTVAEQHDLDRAVRIANRTPGVYEVKSNLTVKAPGAGSTVNLSDEELARRTAEKIQAEVFPSADLDEQWFFGWEIDGDDWELEVEADDSTIILEGDVETLSQFDRVIEVARSVPGVRSVDAGGLEIDDDYWGDPYYPYDPYFDLRSR